MSATNLLESWMVIDGKGIRESTSSLESLIERMVIQGEPVTHEQVLIARTAFRKFGKGSGHGARLNFGDCFAYALAKERNEPLLFVGNDFSRTDIISATD